MLFFLNRFKLGDPKTALVQTIRSEAPTIRSLQLLRYVTFGHYDTLTLRKRKQKQRQKVDVHVDVIVKQTVNGKL